MNVDTLAVGLVINPVTLVDVTIDMSKLTVPMSPIILPTAFIAGPIRPYLSAFTIAEAAEPLSCVLGSRAVCVCRPLLPLGIWVIRLV